MNPLEQLRDIHLPEPVAAWPPAYGWWLLAALLIIGLVSAGVWLARRYQNRKAIRQALALLNEIEACQEDWPQQFNQILKRASMSYFPTTAVSNLYGDAWSQFLAQQLPRKKQAEFLKLHQTLSQNLYTQSSCTGAFEQSQIFCKNWLKQALPPTKARLNASYQGVA